MKQTIYAVGNSTTSSLIIQATRRTVGDEVEIVQRKDPKRPHSTIVGLASNKFNWLLSKYPDLYKFSPAPDWTSVMDMANNYLLPSLVGLNFKPIDKALGYSEFQNILKTGSSSSETKPTAQNNLKDFKQIWQIMTGTRTKLKDGILSTKSGSVIELCDIRQLKLSDELDRLVVSLHVKGMKIGAGEVSIFLGDNKDEGFIIAKDHQDGKGISISGQVIPNDNMMKYCGAKTRKEFDKKFIDKIVSEVSNAALGSVDSSVPRAISSKLPTIIPGKLGGSTFENSPALVPFDAHILDHTAIAINGICVLLFGSSGAAPFLSEGSRMFLAGEHGAEFSKAYKSDNISIKDLDEALFKINAEMIADSKVSSYTSGYGGKYEIRIGTEKGDRQAKELKEIVIDLVTKWRNALITEEDVNKGIKAKVEEIWKENQSKT